LEGFILPVGSVTFPPYDVEVVVEFAVEEEVEFVLAAVVVAAVVLVSVPEAAAAIALVAKSPRSSI
jgi:hypothetical protein